MVCFSWMEFGTQLDVEVTLLKKIENDVTEISSDADSKPKECFRKLILKWLAKERGTGDYPRTWKFVLKALKKCAYDHLATDIEDILSNC